MYYRVTRLDKKSYVEVRGRWVGEGNEIDPVPKGSLGNQVNKDHFSMSASMWFQSKDGRNPSRRGGVGAM